MILLLKIVNQRSKTLVKIKKYYINQLFQISITINVLQMKTKYLNIIQANNALFLNFH